VRRKELRVIIQKTNNLWPDFWSACFYFIEDEVRFKGNGHIWVCVDDQSFFSVDRRGLTLIFEITVDRRELGALPKSTMVVVRMPFEGAGDVRVRGLLRLVRLTPHFAQDDMKDQDDR
jgi:hypothetical protein